jgi:hypothetical protein
MTKRRTVLAGIAAALALGPLAAQAQPQGGMRRLGALLGSLASDPNWQARATGPTAAGSTSFTACRPIGDDLIV